MWETLTFPIPGYLMAVPASLLLLIQLTKLPETYSDTCKVTAPMVTVIPYLEHNDTSKSQAVKRIWTLRIGLAQQALTVVTCIIQIVRYSVDASSNVSLLKFVISSVLFFIGAVSLIKRVEIPRIKREQDAQYGAQYGNVEVGECQIGVVGVLITLNALHGFILFMKSLLVEQQLEEEEKKLTENTLDDVADEDVDQYYMINVNPGLASV